MAKKSKTKRTARPTSMLPDEACPQCGTEMRERVGKLSFPINGEKVDVDSLPHLRCPKCGEIVLRMDESRKLRERAIQAYRDRYNLLSGDEIRTIRERLGMTQDKLAGLLFLGKNTISRWESGRNVQSASMDILLRLIRDVPESVDYLKRRVA